MLVVISPAKTLDFSVPSIQSYTQPVFLDDSQQLVNCLKKMSADDISQLMDISDKLATLNYERFHNWEKPFTLKNAKQAVLAFKGDVYIGLAAEDFDQGDMDFAQQCLRILSGLYGVLMPLDLIQAYRLEMGTRLSNSRGDNLYHFWANKITQKLNRELTRNKSSVLINLASNEYFKSINCKKLKAPVITPVFKEKKNGTYKVISFLAKKARGMMSRYIIKERLQDIEIIKQFKEGEYRYNKKLSTDTEWVFTHG